MQRVVILGTGTNIGKTYVTAALTKTLAEQASTIAAIGVKPIESGVPESSLNPIFLRSPLSTGDSHRPEPAKRRERAAVQVERSDSDQLALASSHFLDLPTPPYTFRDPISPHLAARRAGLSIDLEVVTNWICEVEQTIRQISARNSDDHIVPYTRRVDRAATATQHWLLIETAGAVFSPVSPATTNFSIARALDPAIWILIAPDRLGVLHDLTTTLSTMRSRGRSPDFVLLNQCPPGDDSIGTNEAELRHLNIADPVAVIGVGDTAPPHLAQRLLIAANRQST